MKEIIVSDRSCGIVRQVRLQMNCTQSEFGKKIGLDQPTISLIESRKKLPSETVLEKITHIADVTVYQLTGQEKINYSSI